MKDKIILQEGWCYLEVNSCSTTKKDGSKMYDKAGNPMLRVTYMAVDKAGDSSFVTDYLMASYLSKISNLKHALGINKQFWNGRDFDVDVLANKCCGGVLGIEHNEKYGTNNKILKYVPLAFYNLLKEPEPDATELKPGNKYWNEPPKKPNPKVEDDNDDQEFPF